MSTPRKLYPAHEILIKILEERAMFIKAFNNEGLNINSWQVMTLLAHMISHVQIPENKRCDVINALFDLWDRTLVEKNMSIQAFRKFVLKSQKQFKQNISAHSYLANIIVKEDEIKKDFKKLCLTGENYDIAIKFALIILSRMIVPLKNEQKINYFDNIITIITGPTLKKQKKFHRLLFNIISNQQL